MTESARPTTVDQSARRLDALNNRVRELESVVLAGLALLTGITLALGLLLPYMTFRQDGKNLTPSVLSFAFEALTYRDRDGDLDSTSLVFGVAFGGLVVIVLLAFGVLAMIGGRRADRRSLWFVNTVAVLLVIGVIGVWATVLLGNRSSGFAVHQGPLWLTAGAVLFGILAGASVLRKWWLRES